MVEQGSNANGRVRDPARGNGVEPQRQHTGTTDLPLTDNGRRLAERLKPALAKEAFTLVLVSSLQRARETCALAGVGTNAVIDPDLCEWNYGSYEGRTPKQLHARHRVGCCSGTDARELKASILMPLDVRTPGQMEAVFERIAKDWGRLKFVVHSIASSPEEALQGRVVDVPRDRRHLAQQQRPPSPALPQRKSGLPDLRKISRDPGRPGARGEGADRDGRSS
jgi:histidine phosphatase superfamily protein (branch 1)/enoyl-ACP reductase-like protein